MTTPAPGPVLVGLANPATMPRLLKTARALASVTGGEVVPLCVFGCPPPQDTEAEDAFANPAAHACREMGLPLPRHTESSSVEEGIVKAVHEAGAEMLLLGYAPQFDTKDKRKSLSRIVARVARRVECDLVVADFGIPEEIKRVLVPLATDINLGPISRLARALSLHPDAEVTLARILPQGTDVAGHDEAARQLRLAAEACGVLSTARFYIATHADVVEALVSLAQEHDAMILGAPQARSFTERLFGTVTDHVLQWTRCNVFIVRSRA